MCETSIVEYFSSHEGYKCGYCKSENTCYSHGMWAHTMTPLDYQNLIDRGWRRSGKYVYKPTMHRTCCPQYTIRCEAKRFTLSKSQKKVLKKVHKYLLHGEQERSTSESSEQGMDVSDIHEAMDVQMLKDMKKVSKINTSDIENTESPNHTAAHAVSQQDKTIPPSSPHAMPSGSESSHANDSSSVASPTKSNLDKPCRKAKDIRRERKLQKLLNKGIPADVALSSLQKKSIEPKSVEDFLNELSSAEPVYKLELRLVPSSLENPLFSQTFEESYSVYKKYQMTIHKDPPEKCVQDQYIRFLVKNPYQQPEGAASESSTYGSFHHQYWLNGKLIAVGVIDILPYCLSSVYFYYDPDYSFLSLGTYAALREIALTRELSKEYPSLQYYYMGFYIHSCVKMRYKGQYHPSYLLCPETYIFQPIERCIPKLDKSKYYRLNEDTDKEDCDGVVSLPEVRILYNHKKMTYQMYLRVNRHADDEELVREYAGFVGKKCYKKMLLYRS